MQRISFLSNAIADAGYDSETLALDIEFRDGTVYRYNGIPSGIWTKLLRSKYPRDVIWMRRFAAALSARGRAPSLNSN